jgi:hypothetical protein
MWPSLAIVPFLLLAARGSPSPSSFDSVKRCCLKRICQEPLAANAPPQDSERRPNASVWPAPTPLSQLPHVRALLPGVR